jgi:hypothetical protein
MKALHTPLIALLVILSHPCSANAALCAQCKEKGFIQSVGACEICKAVTSSGAFKLCKNCSDKLAQCEACQQSLKPRADASPNLETKPVPATGEIPKPKNRVYPAHWGAAPRIQTKDLRPLPGGYGMGSSTLAKWIQKNLDADAKAAGVPKDQKAKDVTNAEEIRQVEKKIADMEDFAKRARFTAEGLKQHQEQIAALRERLQVLKGESAPASK